MQPVGAVGVVQQQQYHFFGYAQVYTGLIMIINVTNSIRVEEKSEICENGE